MSRRCLAMTAGLTFGLLGITGLRSADEAGQRTPLEGTPVRSTRTSRRGT
jgi:hypothetical protein